MIFVFYATSLLFVLQAHGSQPVSVTVSAYGTSALVRGPVRAIRKPVAAAAYQMPPGGYNPKVVRRVAGNASVNVNVFSESSKTWVKRILSTKIGTFHLSSLLHCTKDATALADDTAARQQGDSKKQSRIAFLLSGQLPIDPSTPHSDAVEEHVQAMVDNTLKPLFGYDLHLFFCHQPLRSAYKDVYRAFADKVCPAVSRFVELEHTPTKASLAARLLHMQFLRLSLCFLSIPSPERYDFLVRTRPDLRWYGKLMPPTAWKANAVSARVRMYGGSTMVSEAQKVIFYNECVKQGGDSCKMMDDQFFIAPGHMSKTVFNYEIEKTFTDWANFSTCQIKSEGGEDLTFMDWGENQFTEYLHYHNIQTEIFAARACLMRNGLKDPQGGCNRKVEWDKVYSNCRIKNRLRHLEPV